MYFFRNFFLLKSNDPHPKLSKNDVFHLIKMTVEHTVLFDADSEPSFSGETNSKECNFLYDLNQLSPQKLQSPEEIEYQNTPLSKSFINASSNLQSTTCQLISNKELSKKWLNLLIKFTSNFTNILNNKLHNQEILKILFLLNFSKFEDIRDHSSEYFYKFWKIFENHLLKSEFDIDSSVESNISSQIRNEQKINLLKPILQEELYKMPKAMVLFNNLLDNDMTKTEVSSLPKRPLYKKHNKKTNEEIHCSLTTKIGPIHFELYGAIIFSSKTLVNYWLRIIERASKYPKDKKLLQTVASFYLHKSGGITVCLKKWIENDLNHEHILKILKVPFSTFKKYYPAPLKFSQNRYSLDLWRAALDFYYNLNFLEEFQDYFTNYICKNNDTHCLQDFKFLEFILEILSKKEYSKIIDFMKFYLKNKKLYETFLVTYPTECYQIFIKVFMSRLKIKNEDAGDATTDDLLQKEVINLQKNILNNFDFKKLITLSESVNLRITDSFLLYCFDMNYSCCSDIVTYMFDNDIISSVDDFTHEFSRYVNRDEILKKNSLNSSQNRVKNGGFSYGEYQMNFLYKLLEQGCHRNFISGILIEFDDIIKKFLDNRGFINSLFKLFGDMSNTSNFNPFCKVLYREAGLELNKDDDLQGNGHLKVFIRYLETIFNEHESVSNDCVTSENLKDLFESKIKNNSEIETWFNKSLLDDLGLKLGIEDVSHRP